MSRASGTDRANRSSFVTTRVSRGPDRGQRLAQPGPVPVGPGPAVVDLHPPRRYPEPDKSVSLRGHVLLVGGTARVPDQDLAHATTT